MLILLLAAGPVAAQPGVWTPPVYRTPSFDGPDYWQATVAQGGQVFNQLQAGQNPKVNQALYILFDWVIDNPNRLQPPRSSNCRVRYMRTHDQNGNPIVPAPTYLPVELVVTATSSIQQTCTPPKTCQWSFSPTTPGTYKIKFTIGEDGAFLYREVPPGPTTPGTKYYCNKTEVEYEFTVIP